MAYITLTLEEYQELIDSREDFEERISLIEEKIFSQEQENEEEQLIDVEDDLIA